MNNLGLNRNEHIYTKNMFLESHYELGLNLFDKNFTAEKINGAYEKLLNEYIACIKADKPASIIIDDKREARDYLIKFIGNK
jgi:hypothetical protein